ncbi:hypothetical protein KZP23_17655 [Echinicola marina]|uniref:DUF2683 family protein n=1 Tax=Echinicola marina TaxID=2859768 RepID=UPI001CF616C2|nr:DUF2683 family protein [Echinicola marina]UCS92502.1 hypothetical protein KZP23_17655 [Echinicola marina]
METFLIEIEDQEKADAIKAVLKALKVEFKVSADSSESKRIAESAAQGYKEMLEIEKGEKEAK